MNEQQRQESDGQRKKRFRRYALAASGATIACAAAADSATAAIVFYDPADVTAGVGDTVLFDATTGQVQLNPTGKSTVYSFQIDSAPQRLSRAGSLAGGIAGYIPLGTKVQLAGLYQAGDLIDGSLSFISSGSSTLDNDYLGVGAWGGSQPTTGYVGFTLLPAPSSGSKLPNYGWARLTVDDLNETVTLHSFAYQNTNGVGIVAGATGAAGVVPEPSSLAIWALGAAGVTAMRRRKKKKPAAQEAS